MSISDQYAHGHQESVRSSCHGRTADNCAGYLLPALLSGQSLLDVGCGPGTITVDLAARVAPGDVVGLDCSEGVVELAREAARTAGVTNVTFRTGDIYALDFEDATFDVVHAHQVLQHLSDPVAALRELRRVARPGGVVAVRDADYAAMTWYPQSAGLDEWCTLYGEVTVANRAQPDAGRRLLSWVRDAGYDPAGIVASAGTWCYATPADRAWWSELWAERSTSSDFATQAIDHGLADDVALEYLADSWRAWGAVEDAWFTVLHGEILARV